MGMAVPTKCRKVSRTILPAIRVTSTATILDKTVAQHVNILKQGSQPDGSYRYRVKVRRLLPGHSQEHLMGT